MVLFYFICANSCAVIYVILRTVLKFSNDERAIE